MRVCRKMILMPTVWSRLECQCGLTFNKRKVFKEETNTVIILLK
jgi:hypothetical protein